MITNSRLITAFSELEALFDIFRIFGTPDHSTWYDVERMPAYKVDFPKFQAKDFPSVLVTSDKLLYRICKGLLQMNPNCRLSCEEALVLLNVEVPIVKPISSPTNYMICEGSPIKHSSEKILFSWLSEVRAEYSIDKPTLENAILLIRNYTSREVITTNEYQLLGVVCMFLSENLYSVYPRSVEDYLFLCDSKYTANEFDVLLHKVLELVKYDVNMLVV